MLLAAPAARRYGVVWLPERGRLKIAIPAQVQRVDVLAALNKPFATARRAPHLPPIAVQMPPSHHVTTPQHSPTG
jgi:hypothetical protein